jgi:hypothetical protein
MTHLNGVDFEAIAREIVDSAIKDHDDGGYAFAGVNEILVNRIAGALRSVEPAKFVLPRCRHFNGVNDVVSIEEIKRLNAGAAFKIEGE